MRGGELAARVRAQDWLRESLRSYGDRHDDLAGDHTSRLSASTRPVTTSGVTFPSWPG